MLTTNYLFFTSKSQKSVDRFLHLVDGDCATVVRIHTEQNLIDPEEHVDGALNFGNGDSAIIVTVPRFGCHYRLIRRAGCSGATVTPLTTPVPGTAFGNGRGVAGTTETGSGRRGKRAAIAAAAGAVDNRCNGIRLTLDSFTIAGRIYGKILQNC